MYRLGDRMSKNRRSDQKTSKSRSEDTFDISSDSSLLRTFIKQNTFKPAPLIHIPPPTQPKFLEDRRAFHPDPKSQRPIAANPRSAARLKVSPTQLRPSSPKLPSKVAFAAPTGVALCVSRKNRREVLFALNRTKKGAGSKRTRTKWSEVKC